MLKDMENMFAPIPPEKDHTWDAFLIGFLTIGTSEYDSKTLYILMLMPIQHVIFSETNHLVPTQSKRPVGLGVYPGILSREGYILICSKY